MPGFHIEHVMLKLLINHKREGRGPLGSPLNPPLLVPAQTVLCPHLGNPICNCEHILSISHWQTPNWEVSVGMHSTGLPKVFTEGSSGPEFTLVQDLNPVLRQWYLQAWLLEFTSHRIGLVHQHCHCFIVLIHQGDGTENGTIATGLD